MPRKRFFELEPTRREGILAAAAVEFAEQGYGSASVNRIIESAEISKGSLYYYFEDKEDLFGAVLEQALLRVMDELGFVEPERLSAEDYWPSFRELMHRSIEYMRGNAWYVELFRSFHRLRGSAPESQAVSRVMRQMGDYLHAVLARGQELGVVRSDLPLPLLVEITSAVDAAGDRWRLEHWDTTDPATRLAHADAHIDLMRDMLHAKNQGWEER